MLEKIEGRRRRRRGQQNEMVGWHHRLNGRKLEQAPGDSKGQGSLVCYSLSGHKELDTIATEQQQKRHKTKFLAHEVMYKSGNHQFPQNIL